MLRTILEELASEQIPPEQFSYENPANVDVKISQARWVWILKRCAELPDGQCVVLPVPEGWEATDYAKGIRQNLYTSNRVKNRFSIRTSKDSKSIVVLKAETWIEYYERLNESAGPAPASTSEEIVPLVPNETVTAANPTAETGMYLHTHKAS